MKKLGLFLLMAVVMCMSVKADDDRVITYQQLPQNAQEFLKQHFSKLVPLVVTMDWDDYTIMYETGEKIEFNKQGEWKDIDCRASHVPAVLIPQQIKSSVQQSFPGTTIIKIDRNRRGYEVKLNNGLEVEFSRNFQVIDIDD